MSLNVKQEHHMFKIVFFYFRESLFLFAMLDTYEDTTGFFLKTGSLQPPFITLNHSLYFNPHNKS